MDRFHGYGPRHYVEPPLGTSYRAGKFGRMFPELTRWHWAPDNALEKLGLAMLEPDDPQKPKKNDNPNIDAGFTYLGQFVDHDITLDTTTLQEQAHDPDAIENFRTPRLDLDCVYGLGPNVNPWLMDRNDGAKLLLGRTVRGAGDPNVKDGLAHDLPRTRQGRALIGDHRNDENLLVAQTHVAFLKFHNAVVDAIRGSPMPESLFHTARKKVIAHYQAMVLRDFLTKLCDVNDIAMAVNGSSHCYRYERYSRYGVPYMPIEFSVAAYRLGHSMVRQVYSHNRVFRPGAGPSDFRFFFIFSGLSGNITGPDGVQTPTFPFPQVKSLPSDWIIDWRRFFDFQTKDKSDGFDLNKARLIDPLLAKELHALPGTPPLPDGKPNPEASLAVRNLKRGVKMRLPSGQDIARFLKVQPLSPNEIATGPDGAAAKEFGLHRDTPLWYYILKEAQVRQKGERLGAVGSRIVAETFVGLLRGDPDSILGQNPWWRFGEPMPWLDLTSGAPTSFTMADLIAFGAGGRTKEKLSPVDDPANLAPPAV